MESFRQEIDTAEETQPHPSISIAMRTDIELPFSEKKSLVASEEDYVGLGGMHKKMVPSCKASHKCGQPIKTHQECRSCSWSKQWNHGFFTSFSTWVFHIVFHVVLHGYPRVGSHFTTTIGPCGSAVGAPCQTWSGLDGHLSSVLTIDGLYVENHILCHFILNLDGFNRWFPY